jgi:molybdate transport system substrate-binding protein
LANAQGDPPILLVAAASDLNPLQESLIKAFREKTGYLIRFTMGSSGMLAQQIAHGAPFDVFLSADESRVRKLAASGQIVPQTLTIYATGRLGIWSKGARLRSVADLAGPEVRSIAIANPVHAPYGVAAKQALAGLWPKVESRMVYAESVRQALEFATSGNADAAIVAWSLVLDRGGVLIPDRLHAPIRQSGGVVQRSNHQAAARDLLRFLAGKEGQALLSKYGFGSAR